MLILCWSWILVLGFDIGSCVLGLDAGIDRDGLGPRKKVPLLQIFSLSMGLGIVCDPSARCAWTDVMLEVPNARVHETSGTDIIIMT